MSHTHTITGPNYGESPFKRKQVAVQNQNEVKKAIDFTQIYQVIYELFEKEGVLNHDIKDNRKISFRMSYPDFEFQNDEETVLTYQLMKREYTTLNTPAGKITQMQSQRLIDQEHPIYSGNRESFERRQFSNTVALTVFSTSVERAYNVAHYVETLMLKHSGYFHEKLATKPIYLGMTGNFHNNQYKNRGFSQTLMFVFNTSEISTLLHEEIEEINVTIK